MTAPIIIRRKGPLEGLQKGFLPLLQQIQFNRTRQQQQQQLEIQKQGLELQKLAQRNQEKQRTSTRFFQLMDTFGPDILQDPMVAQQVTQLGLDPKTLLRSHTKQVQAQEKATQAEQDNLLAAFPAELQPAATAMIRGFNLIGPEAGVAAFREIASRTLDKDKLEKLLVKFPEFADLPAADAMEGIAKLITLQAQVQRNLSPQAMLEARANLAEIRTGIAQAQLELQRMELAARREGGTPQQLINFAQDVKAIIDAQIGDFTNLAAQDIAITATRAEKIRGILGQKFIELDARLNRIIERAVERVEPSGGR